MRPEIAQFFSDKVYQGGLTYNAHPISLAAAIANIQVIKEDNLIQHTREMGTMLHRKLTDLGEQHLSIGEVRNLGLFGIIELVRDRRTKQPLTPYNTTSSEMAVFRQAALEAGLFIYTHWHTILVIPPLIITPTQLDDGFTILDQAISKIDELIRA
jgi:taurine--2-oxoglutarate transaminase